VSRLSLILLFGAVTAIQVAIFYAAEGRNQAAQRLARVAVRVQGSVTSAEGKIVEGKSRYAVSYRFETPKGASQGEEYFSMRQAQVPQKGESIAVFYDPQQPEVSTLTDPKVVVSRAATLKLLTLGFGAFTYAFIYVIWKNRPADTKQSE